MPGKALQHLFFNTMMNDCQAIKKTRHALIYLPSSECVNYPAAKIRERETAKHERTQTSLGITHPNDCDILVCEARFLSLPTRCEPRSRQEKLSRSLLSWLPAGGPLSQVAGA